MFVTLDIDDLVDGGGDEFVADLKRNGLHFFFICVVYKCAYDFRSVFEKFSFADKSERLDGECVECPLFAVGNKDNFRVIVLFAEICGEFDSVRFSDADVEEKQIVFGVVQSGFQAFQFGKPMNDRLNPV